MDRYLPLLLLEAEEVTFRSIQSLGFGIFTGLDGNFRLGEIHELEGTIRQSAQSAVMGLYVASSAVGRNHNRESQASKVV
jgi:hypothetical protein